MWQKVHLDLRLIPLKNVNSIRLTPCIPVGRLVHELSWNLWQLPIVVQEARTQIGMKSDI